MLPYIPTGSCLYRAAFERASALRITEPPLTGSFEQTDSRSLEFASAAGFSGWLPGSGMLVKVTQRESSHGFAGAVRLSAACLVFFACGW